MVDIKNPRLLYLKGGLMLATGLLSAGLLLLEHRDLRTMTLLGLSIWGFCRAYYFAFYVVQHYIDPAHKFAGLTAFFRYLLSRPH